MGYQRWGVGGHGTSSRRPVIGRAFRVPQWRANNGRERAAATTRDAERIERRRTFDLFTSP